MSRESLKSLDLSTSVVAAQQAAVQRGTPQWAGFCVELPICDALAVFESSAATSSALSLDLSERFYWERPDQGRALVGLGCLASIETAGAGRFEKSSMRAAHLFESIQLARAATAAEVGPFLVGGFAFSRSESNAPHWRDFPNSRLVLPRLAVSIAEGRAWCTILRACRPGDDVAQAVAGLHHDLARFEEQLAQRAAPVGLQLGCSEAPVYHAVADRSHADYRAQVETALRAIAEGEFEKVVLARSVCLRREGGFETRSLLDTLRRSHPSCAVFAIATGAPSSLFLGATPECLMVQHGQAIETASVAGSAPRGREPVEDLRLGRDLKESKKEQAEHAVVVRALRAALTPLCEELEIPEAPRLMRLQHLQHLETPITGRAREGVTILDLLGAVHPTPAVAGEPRQLALDWLADNEELDRGWYGGPIGFADASGGGEFFAALRSSLIRGDEARLFAGAGIVAGSQPEAELRETRLKLRAMLAPLFEI